MAYEHDGKWYSKETHEELTVTTLEELFAEVEADNKLKREAANQAPPKGDVWPCTTIHITMW